MLERNMLRKFFVFSLFLCIFQVNPSLGFEAKGQDCAKCHTSNSDEARNLLKDIIPNLKVLGVSPGPTKGFWEVYLESGGRKGLIYVDFLKKHFISGSLVSISEKRNLTQERLTDLNRVDVSQIPLEDALVMGDPKAKIRIVAFDDPD
jgi:thiol:disulfide interchange protein DsbC